MSDPTPQRALTLTARIRRRAVSMVITLLVVYALWCLAALVIQDRLIFPGVWMREVEEPRLFPPGGVVLTRPLDSGGEVEAWFIPPERPVDGGSPLLVFFHGNGELIDDYARDEAHWARLGYGVLMVEYRGYGASAGRPGRRAIRDDALWFLEKVVKDERVDAARVVYIGRSLGGAIATDLIADRPPAAIVVESAFTDIRAMFRRAGLPGFLARHRYNPREALGAFEGPILLIHGERDGVISVRHGRALARALPNATYLEVPVGHYPSVEWVGYDEAIWAFLRESGIAIARERGASEGE